MKSKAKPKRQKRPLDKPPHFLKEWREHKQLTQEQLADLVGTDKSVISLLESGGRGLSDKWARRLAEALQIKPGWLLDHSPDSLPTSIFEVWAAIPDDRQAQAIRVLQTFTKTGT